MGAESARSTGGAHIYRGGRVAATAVRLVRAAGASALGTLGHVQETISSDAPAIAQSRSLVASRLRGGARGAARQPIGRKQAGGEGGSAPWFKECVQSLLNVRPASKDIDMNSFWARSELKIALSARASVHSSAHTPDCGRTADV